MPGVLIVEALAQVGAVAILSQEENKGKVAYFGAINSANSRKKWFPAISFGWNAILSNAKGSVGIGVRPRR